MNAKDTETVDRFITLRAQGWPFVRIAAELQVHRNTLLQWSRIHQVRIQNQRAIEAEQTFDLCKLTRQLCLENLGEDFRRIREEIARRDLHDIPTARLFLLAAQLRAEANHLNGPLQLHQAVPFDSDPLDAIPEPTLTWEA